MNVVGSFLMGVLIRRMLAERGGMRFAPFLTVGLLGGFTTFSAFSLDAVTLFERGQVGAAAGYVGRLGQRCRSPRCCWAFGLHGARI